MIPIEDLKTRIAQLDRSLEDSGLNKSSATVAIVKSLELVAEAAVAQASEAQRLRRAARLQMIVGAATASVGIVAAIIAYGALVRTEAVSLRADTAISKMVEENTALKATANRLSNLGDVMETVKSGVLRNLIQTEDAAKSVQRLVGEPWVVVQLANGQSVAVPSGVPLREPQVRQATPPTETPTTSKVP